MKTRLRYATTRQARCYRFQPATGIKTFVRIDMKIIMLVLALSMTGIDLWAQVPTPRAFGPRARGTNNPSGVPTATPNVSALPTTPPGLPPSGIPNSNPAGENPQAEVPGYTFTYEGVDVSQVLNVYADLVNKTLIRANLPQASIVLKTQTPLTKSEAIQALQAVLAVNGISIVPINDKFVKVLPTDQAGGAGGPLDTTEAANLPDLGSYVTHIVQLNYVKPSAMIPLISPLAKVNSIFPIDDNGILVIRDYAENVKRMLEMIQQIDVSSPQEYTNEVIEIKYALAEDIANALNSLGGQGAATVSIGSSAANPGISGVTTPGGAQRPGGAGASGVGGFSGGVGGVGGSTYGGGANQGRGGLGTQGTTTPNGAPAGGSTFQQRLQNIIASAARPTGTPGQQEQIQVFGQAKIIADARANSLLVFATRADMERIKAVISKLDVLLSQVLIESVIMDVDLKSGWSLGVSAGQQPRNLNGHNPVITTAGGMNNGQPFFSFMQNAATNLFPGNLINTLPSDNLSYFGNIGDKWDVALTAAAADSGVTIIQRPRIQTSQAKPAQFFVGNTVPYITGTSYGTGYNGANSSQYSQLSVGVELDVTPFINPDGLVVMDIQQEIDDLNGTTRIDNNDVPNTVKRTLSSEIAVRDKDTIMLGGFIRSNKQKSKSGLPILQDIPLLGALFSSRTSAK
ncbi:MAG TPA: secretin N-terminal domain-containing protein, partial [Desulfuromonadaceae bacterium]|nr:secretin N-terminal domain-containing protein [Desulfuromonadaceae bacterium]